MEEKKDNSDKKIKIVKGHSKDIIFSDVKDNLTFEVHENTTKQNGEIIIPENQNNEDKDSD